MASALKPALLPASAWLQDDSQANAGSGTTPYTRQDADAPARKVPARDSPLPVEVPADTAGDPGILYSPPHWTGAWPSFSQGAWKRYPLDRGQGIAHGDPDPYRAANALGGYDHRTGQYTTLNEYAGHDHHSQQVDGKGWQQDAPTGRSAARLRRGDGSRGFRFFWPPTAERPTPRRLAVRAAPNNSPAGTPGVLNGAALPAYSPLSLGGPGTIAYESPAPPQTTTAQPSQAAADWAWGGWQ